MTAQKPKPKLPLFAQKSGIFKEQNALVGGGFLFANSVFAATQVIKLLNAGCQNKTMQISYQICSGKVSRTPENTTWVNGHSFSSISGSEDQYLLITKVVKTENGICSGWFGIDRALTLNSFGTKNILQR